MATFAYRGLQVDKSEVTPKDDTLAVTVDVTNMGSWPGAETVELYVSDLVASVTPPVRLLKRFQKVMIKPEQTQTLRFELSWDDLAFIGRDNKPVVEPGEFNIQVGELSVGFTVRTSKKQS